MCRVAKQSRMQVSARNCNAPEARMRQVLQNGSIAEQRMVFDKLRHLELLANEEGLPDYPYFAPDLSFVTVIRDPITRYLSQFLHVESRLRRGVVAGELDRDPALRAHFLHPKQLQPSLRDFLLSKSQPAGGFRDNFLIRYFAGHSARSKPEGTLTTADLCQALCHIHRFDQILNFSTAFVSPLVQMLRVNESDDLASRSRTGTRNNAGDKITEALPLALMHSKSRFDYKFIQFVRSVNACRIKSDTYTHCWPDEWQQMCDRAACIAPE